MADVGDHYGRSRRRLTALLEDGVDAGGWSTPVAACPGWTVRDVVGHLVGVVEDAVAGRLTGPPGPEETAVEVERHRDDGPADLLAQWNEIAEPFERMIAGLEFWPAAFDVVSHEHDIRTALGRPGARDDDVVHLSAPRLIEGLAIDGAITVDFGDGTARSTPGPGPDYRLRASRFEVFRFRFGRRSRDQVVGLDWSRDPSAVVDDLFIFGPATAPLVE